jgi:hypothetical protein
MGELAITEPQALIIEALAERGTAETQVLLHLDGVPGVALADALGELVGVGLVAHDRAGSRAYALTAAGRRAAKRLDRKKPYPTIDRDGYRGKGTAAYHR